MNKKMAFDLQTQQRKKKIQIAYVFAYINSIFLFE